MTDDDDDADDDARGRGLFQHLHARRIIRVSFPLVNRQRVKQPSKFSAIVQYSAPLCDELR